MKKKKKTIARADEAWPTQIGGGRLVGSRLFLMQICLHSENTMSNHPMSNVQFMPRETIISHYSKSMIKIPPSRARKRGTLSRLRAIPNNRRRHFHTRPFPQYQSIAPIAYSSSSASSSTLGAAYLCRASSPPVAICVSVAVVVALAGSGWPVVAAKVDCALALPILPDERLFFFFLAVCTLWLVSKTHPCLYPHQKLIRTHLMPGPDRFK